MELNRQFRFLIPTSVLLLSFAWGSLLDPQRCVLNIATCFLNALPFNEFNEAIKVIAAFATGASFVMAIGFLITSLSIVFLRIWRIRRKPYEAGVSDEALAAIRVMIGAKELATEKQEQLFHVSIYDHLVLREEEKGLHEWLGRRWNMFLVSFHCCVALFLAHILMLLFQWQNNCKMYSQNFLWFWYGPDVLFFLLLGINAFKACAENRRMIEFLATGRFAPRRRRTERV